MAVAWRQDQQNFVADKVFPMVPVKHMSDLYAYYQLGTFYRAGQMAPRAPGQEPSEAGYEITTGSYRCVEWALQTTIDDTVRANADAPLNPDLAAMRFLETQAMIQRDTLWANEFFVTGVWGETDQIGVTGSPGSNQFIQFDQTGTTPIETIRGQGVKIASGTGYTPNVLVCGALAKEGLLLNPEVAERVKYTQQAQSYFGNPDAALAEILGVQKILTARGVSNTAAENQADSIGFIVDQRSILLAYAAPAPTITDPSAGYTFAWTGLIPGVNNAFGGVIMRGRRDLAHSDVIQIRGSYSQNIVAPDLGVFFKNAVSTSYSG
ncbi:MAG: hypothetical protein ACYCQK_01665 [Acidiferrobacteraceae bacterium]